RIWDVASTKLLSIQLINSSMFEKITGFPAPPTPIDADMYKNMGLPFFQLYREKPVSSVSRSGAFDKIKTLSQFDAEQEDELTSTYDPDNLAMCHCRQRLANAL